SSTTLKPSSSSCRMIAVFPEPGAPVRMNLRMQCLSMDDVQKSRVSHENTWLIFLGFLCAKDRCVIVPRRWHYDTRTDVRSSVSAASMAVPTRLQSISLCTEPAAVPPPRMPRALPWMAPPSPGSPEKRAFSWCCPAPQFSPGLDHQKTRAIISARLRGREELF